MSVLVTGGAGFIGSHLVDHLLASGSEDVVVYDALRRGGSRDNLQAAGERFGRRLAFVEGDVTDGQALREVLNAHRPRAICHLAAESHVDRSILAPAPFVRTNVLGTQMVLDVAREAGLRVLHVSTDEVYGDLHPAAEPAREDQALRPSSPYAATKAGADCLCLAAVRTFGQDVVIARPSNNVGPRQDAEKFIPTVFWRARAGLPVPLYGDGKQERDWLFVGDCVRGLQRILERGRAGEVYNLGTGTCRPNRDVARRIIDLLGCSPDLLQEVPDRPGHDRRYAVDARKAHDQLGWRPEVAFDQALEQAVRSYGRR